MRDDGKVSSRAGGNGASFCSEFYPTQKSGILENQEIGQEVSLEQSCPIVSRSRALSSRDVSSNELSSSDESESWQLPSLGHWHTGVTGKD